MCLIQFTIQVGNVKYVIDAKACKFTLVEVKEPGDFANLFAREEDGTTTNMTIRGNWVDETSKDSV